MIKWLTCLWVGILLFTTGIYLSTLLSTKWVVIGASLAVFGGILMGGSSYFLPKPIKK